MKDLLNTLSNPGIFPFPLLTLLLYIVSKPRAWSVRVGTAFFCFTGILFTYSITDSNFQKLISEPDNVPVALLLLLSAFFLWTGLRQAHENDRRRSLDIPPVENEFRKKVTAWPDLVYIELISMVLMTSFLIVWSLMANAPLEEWADPTFSPNPSKAPWYFLGLQELLVYFDPWIAGVVIPLLIVFGLMAIPYIDSSRAYSGYYSFSGRKFALLFFIGGFFFWIILIVIGTFLRGQNWNFYGPFEDRELLKNNVVHFINLSDIIWVNILGAALPKNWFPREIFGITTVFFYLICLPLILRKRLKKRAKSGFQTGLMRHFRPEKGERHLITLLLFFTAGGVLIKIFLRLLFHIRYVVYIPEFLLNI